MMTYQLEFREAPFESQGELGPELITDHWQPFNRFPPDMDDPLFDMLIEEGFSFFMLRGERYAFKTETEAVKAKDFLENLYQIYEFRVLNVLDWN